MNDASKELIYLIKNNKNDELYDFVNSYHKHLYFDYYLTIEDLNNDHNIMKIYKKLPYYLSSFDKLIIYTMIILLAYNKDFDCLYNKRFSVMIYDNITERSYFSNDFTDRQKDILSIYLLKTYKSNDRTVYFPEKEIKHLYNRGYDFTKSHKESVMALICPSNKMVDFKIRKELLRHITIQDLDENNIYDMMSNDIFYNENPDVIDFYKLFFDKGFKMNIKVFIDCLVYDMKDQLKFLFKLGVKLSNIILDNSLYFDEKYSQLTLIKLSQIQLLVDNDDFEQFIKNNFLHLRHITEDDAFIFISSYIL